MLEATAAAARSGTPSSTTRSSTWSTSAPATARPGTRSIRSPGGGDNLFLSSIVAVNADTGEYVWHYQENPGESGTTTATQPMILADLTIGGRRRQGADAGAQERLLLCARPHDREAALGRELRAGQLGHADRHEDRPAGREPGSALQRQQGRPSSSPAPLGAHNWHPMAFSPKTGLVYIPVTESTTGFQSAPADSFKVQRPGLQHRHGLSFSDEITRLYAAPGAPQRGNIKSYLRPGTRWPEGGLARARQRLRPARRAGHGQRPGVLRRLERPLLGLRRPHRREALVGADPGQRGGRARDLRHRRRAVRGDPGGRPAACRPARPAPAGQRQQLAHPGLQAGRRGDPAQRADPGRAGRQPHAGPAAASPAPTSR